MSRIALTNGDWAAFQRNPLPGVHVAQLARCLFPVQIQDEAALRRTAAVEPFRTQFIELLHQALGLETLSGLTPAPVQAGLAALSVENWQNAAERCGLMYWSPVLVRELRAPMLRSLAARFGVDWWHWVKSGLDGVGDALVAQQYACPDTAQEWENVICAAGHAVIAGWVAQQEEGLAAWLRLKQAPAISGGQGDWQIEDALAAALVNALVQYSGVAP